MIVGIAVETTVDSNEARAVTSTSAAVTARRLAGSNRGGGELMSDAESHTESARPRSDARKTSSTAPMAGVPSRTAEGAPGVPSNGCETSEQSEGKGGRSRG